MMKSGTKYVIAGSSNFNFDSSAWLTKSTIIMLVMFGLFLLFVLINSPLIQAQSEEFLPGPDIEVEGIPKIPKSLVTDINKYNYSFGWPVVGWNLTGTDLVLKNKGGGFSLYLASVPGRIPKLWLRQQETALYDIYPDPTKRYVIFNKDTEGDEVFQMYLFDTEKKKRILLSDGTSRDTEPVWSRSGQQLVFSCSKRGEIGVSLCLINPFTKKLTRPLINTRGNYFVSQDWSPDERYIAYCEFFSNTLSQMWLKDLVSGRSIPLTRHTKSDQAYYDSIQFSPDGNGVYFVTDRNNEFKRPAYMDLKTKKIRYLVSDIEWDVEKLALSPNGKRLAIVFNVNGISKLYIYEVENGVKHHYEMVEEGLITNLSWNPQSNSLAFNFTSHRTPGDVRVLNLSESKISLWVKGFTGNLKVDEWKSPELVSWKSFDGRVITGYMYRPPDKFTGKRPVIIDIHGGPEDQYRPAFGYSDNYIINELGIIKIYPNIRGSDGFGKTFLNLDNGLLRVDAVKDVGALINWAINQPGLDSSRILIQGASYGGYVSLSTAVLYNDKIKAVIAESMPTNLATFISSTKGWRRQLQRLEYGDERDEKVKLFMDKTSPVNLIDQIKIPLFIIHGSNDVRAPISEAKNIIQRARGSGTPLWFLVALNEGHNFTGSHAWLYRLCSVAQFIAFCLGE